MTATTDRTGSLLARVRTDPLLRNSLLLLMSSVVQGGFGFLFWVLCARLYAPSAVGTGSALIAASVFITYVSLLGFNSSLIRYLPSSSPRDRDLLITGSALLVFTVGTLAGLGYAAALPWLAPELAPEVGTPARAAAFAVLVGISGVNLLTDSVFIALRAAHFHFAAYAAQSLIKVALPVACVTLGGFGLYVATGVSIAAATLLSLTVCAVTFGYRPHLRGLSSALRTAWSFSGLNHVANLFNIVPVAAVPTLILNRFGPDASGHYSVAFAICNLLYAVAYALSQSLFAEGSQAGSQTRALVRRTTLLSAKVLVPGSVLLALLGPLILPLFGAKFGDAARGPLTVLALAGPFVAWYVLSSSALRITGQLGTLITVNVLYVAAILLPSATVARSPTDVAWAWLAGNLLAGSYAWLRLRHRPDGGSGSTALHDGT